MLSNALPYELQQLCDDMRAILSANCGPRPGPTERKRSQQDKENENRTHGKKAKTEIEQGRVPLGNHHKPEKNVEEAHLTAGKTWYDYYPASFPKAVVERLMFHPIYNTFCIQNRM